MEINSHTLIPLFTPGTVHSGSASRDDCARMFPDKLRVRLFLERFPHCRCSCMSVKWTNDVPQQSNQTAGKVDRTKLWMWSSRTGTKILQRFHSKKSVCKRDTWSPYVLKNFTLIVCKIFLLLWGREWKQFRTAKHLQFSWFGYRDAWSEW